MGLRFKLNLKLVSPLRSHFHTTTSSSFPFLSKGRECQYNLARLSSFVNVLQNENTYNHLSKAQTCSSTSVILENDYLLVEGTQASMGISLNMSKDDKHPSSPKNNSSNFGLLMESVNKLESISTNSDVAVLERNILQQLERLGALQLFHICLSRTLMSYAKFDYSDTQNRPFESRGSCLVDVRKTIVRSTKKRKRKLGRERDSRVASRLALPSKSIKKDCDFYTTRRKSNSKIGRLMIAKNEAEMSKGMVDSLENVKMALEQETGRVVTLTSWAEAVGVDVKELQQQLHFGWYCRDELLRSTRSLVLYIARNYRGSGVALEDIIQAGYIGVLQGAIRFDDTRGYRFSTYVQYWIRKSMSTLVAQHSRGVRIPFSLSKAINQIYKARKTLNGSQGKYPSDGEISKLTGLTLANIASANKCLRVVGSLDQKMGDATSAKILELTPDKSIKNPEEIVMRRHMIKEIHHILKTLEPTERQVLVLRFGLHDHQRKSLEEIGRLFGASKEWIRRVERKALMKLRNGDFCINMSHYIHLLVVKQITNSCFVIFVIVKLKHCFRPDISWYE